jgi:hypothetical protein
MNGLKSHSLIISFVNRNDKLLCVTKRNEKGARYADINVKVTIQTARVSPLISR